MVIGLVEDIVKNPSSVNSTIDLLDFEVCDTIKNGTSAEIARCKDLVSLTFKTILPMLFKGAASLAWNIPLVMCADIVKVCSVPCCTDAPTVPQQLFLSFTNSSDWYSSLAVTWVTQVQTPGAHVRFAAVGSASGFETSAEVLPTRTYTVFGWIGAIHYAQMSGLQPSTTYWYQVGSDEYGWSTNYSFTTMSQHVGHKGVQTLKMIAIADMGWGPNSNNTLTAMLNAVKTQNISAILFPGDVGYADGNTQAWDIFMNKFEPLFATVPVTFSIGNHEAVWANGTPFRTRLAASQPAPSGLHNATESYDKIYHRQQIGTANFVVLNSETEFDTANIDVNQIAWAKSVMDANPKSSQNPWLVTSFHRPLYCTGDKLQCSIFTDILRLQVEELFNDKKVDLVFAGHMHIYELSWPIGKGGVVAQQDYKSPTAPVYIIGGQAGNREGNDHPKDEPWLNYGNGAIGFTTLEFSTVGNQHELTVTAWDAATQQQLNQIVIEKTL